jgi:ribosomal protein S18 acetylase RimI-like enzyme
MPQTWRVERVDEQRWRELRTIRLTALEADPSAFASSLERELAFPEERWREWPRVSACFIAWQSDGGAEQAIGLAAGMDRQNGTEAELVALWVAPEHRELRAGEALVTAAIEWARAAQYSRLCLWVTTGNAAAIGLYQRLGFVATGVVKPLPSDPQLTEVEYGLQLS